MAKRIEEKYKVCYELSKIIEGTTVEIDVLKINNKFLLNIGSLGFDAEVLKSFLFLKEKTPIKGKVLYTVAIVGNIIRTLALNKKYTLRIEIDGEYIAGDYFLLAFANGRYYGGGMQPAPNAELDNGFMDICLIKKTGIYNALWAAKLMKKGLHTKLKEVEIIRAKQALIRGKIPLPVNIDGEFSLEQEVKVDILPKSIEIIIPRK